MGPLKPEIPRKKSPPPEGPNPGSLFFLLRPGKSVQPITHKQLYYAVTEGRGGWGTPTPRRAAKKGKKVREGKRKTRKGIGGFELGGKKECGARENWANIGSEKKRNFRGKEKKIQEKEEDRNQP